MTEKDHIRKRCSHCHFVRYCSAECQRSHWRTAHRFDCGIVANGGFSYDGLKAPVCSTFSCVDLKACLQVKYGPVCAYNYELLRHLGCQASIAAKHSYHRYFNASRPHLLIPPRPRSAVIWNRDSISEIHF